MLDFHENCENRSIILKNIKARKNGIQYIVRGII